MTDRGREVGGWERGWMESREKMEVRLTESLCHKRQGRTEDKQNNTVGYYLQRRREETGLKSNPRATSPRSAPVCLRRGGADTLAPHLGDGGVV